MRALFIKLQIGFLMAVMILAGAASAASVPVSFGSTITLGNPGNYVATGKTVASITIQFNSTGAYVLIQGTETGTYTNGKIIKPTSKPLSIGVQVPTTNLVAVQALVESLLTLAAPAPATPATPAAPVTP